MEEIWKDIPEWEDSYQVSNIGRVRSKVRFVKNKYDYSKSVRQSKYLKQALNVSGYFKVSLSRACKHKMYVAHRLVASAFIPNPENKRCVNHKNGIKTDNRVENLEWATHSENSIHAFKHGLSKGNFGEKNRSARLVLNLNTGIYYSTIREAAKSVPVKDYILFQRLNDFGFVRV